MATPAQLQTDTSTAAREALAQKVAGAFAKFCTHKSDIVHLWAEFAKLQSGETIMKCRTKTEFCEKVLGRSIRTVQYMIQGGNFKRSTPVAAVTPVPVHETVSRVTAPMTVHTGRKMREPVQEPVEITPAEDVPTVPIYSCEDTPTKPTAIVIKVGSILDFNGRLYEVRAGWRDDPDDKHAVSILTPYLKFMFPNPKPVRGESPQNVGLSSAAELVPKA